MRMTRWVLFAIAGKGQFDSFGGAAALVEVCSLRVLLVLHWEINIPCVSASASMQITILIPHFC